MSTDWENLGATARNAAFQLGSLSTEKKNAALNSIAVQIAEQAEKILAANGLDIEQGTSDGLGASLVDRLLLTESRLHEIIEGVRQVIALPDPVGVSIKDWSIENGIQIEKISVPLGVIGIIYEARPNVTVDAGVLCLKAGNAVVLRGSSSALHSNIALVEVMQQGLEAVGVQPGAVQLVRDTNRESVGEFLKQRNSIDVMIPRGGAGLIQFVCENSSVPVLETGAGNCHVYLDANADAERALAIVINAKTQRPSVCNAIETVLVHAAWAEKNMARLLKALNEHGVTVKACERVRDFDSSFEAATEQDWATEFLDLTLAVKIVGSVQEAVTHINAYGTRHSECIVSRDEQAASFFLQNVDAAAVYHNASTRFTDGFQFGFGAEIGISTQKLHARGPMGLPELTSYKYLCRGTGQIRE